MSVTMTVLGSELFRRQAYPTETGMSYRRMTNRQRPPRKRATMTTSSAPMVETTIWFPKGT